MFVAQAYMVYACNIAPYTLYKSYAFSSQDKQYTRQCSLSGLLFIQATSLYKAN